MRVVFHESIIYYNLKSIAFFVLMKNDSKKEWKIEYYVIKMIIYNFIYKWNIKRILYDFIFYKNCVHQSFGFSSTSALDEIIFR